MKHSLWKDRLKTDRDMERVKLLVSEKTVFLW